ncbi:MAG: DsrE family protein [Candidatus Rokubacteria bacterium]|nr:DsrE family protein [Candidatus Rokubacteria bacterium]
MASILLVLTSSPHSPPGQRALALAGSLAEAGHAITLCCLQDAVFLGVGDQARPALRRLLGGGAQWAVLREDLAMRGLRAPEGASVVDHAGVVALLTAGHDRVIGAL